MIQSTKFEIRIVNDPAIWTDISNKTRLTELLVKPVNVSSGKLIQDTVDKNFCYDKKYKRQ